LYIQVNAKRLKFAYEHRIEFIKYSKGTSAVHNIIENWHIFQDFLLKEDTHALLNKKEYFILCKFEEYFKEVEEATISLG
jgi:hypothetical protein